MTKKYPDMFWSSVTRVYEFISKQVDIQNVKAGSRRVGRDLAMWLDLPTSFTCAFPPHSSAPFS